MSNLPNGWQSVYFPEVCELNPRKHAPDYSGPEMPVTFVPMASVDAVTGTIASPTEKTYSQVSKGFTAFRENDVIFAKITPCMENGKAAVARNLISGVGFGSTEFHVFRSNGSVLPEYFFYFVRQERFRKQAEENFTGSVGQRRVPLGFLEESTLPLAPLNEQKRIVGKLEKLLGKVEAAQERLDKIPAILKRFRQSVLAAACSGKLTTDWRAKTNVVVEKSERLNHLRENRLELAKTQKSREILEAKFVDRINEDYPQNWLLLTAECVCDFITKGTTPNTRMITPIGDVPFLKVFHIVDNKLDFHSIPCFVPQETHRTLLSRSRVFPTDVLMNIVGPPLNKVAIVPHDFPEWNINQALAIFRPIDGLLPEFVQLILSHEGTIAHIVRESRGIVGQSNISLDQCRNIEIPIPVLPEQKEIVRRVEEFFKFADQIEDRYQKARTYTDKLTQSILAKAFRGELVPQDPNDEPADVLLKQVARKMAKLNANGGINGPLERGSKKSSRKKSS